MSAYYGAVMGGSSRTVLCHRITVQTYTKTLPNGKTITVQGYSRAGDAAAYQEAKGRRREAESRINAGRRQVSAAASGYNQRKKTQYSVRQRIGMAGQGSREMAGGYADIAKQKFNDIKETMQVGIGNFLEQAKVAGSTIAAYCGMGLDWLKNLIGNVGKAIGGAVETVSREARNLYNKNVPRKGNLTPKTSPASGKRLEKYR